MFVCVLKYPNCIYINNDNASILSDKLVLRRTAYKVFYIIELFTCLIQIKITITISSTRKYKFNTINYRYEVINKILSYVICTLRRQIILQGKIR